MWDSSVLEEDIDGIHRRYRSHDLTVSELVEFYLARVDDVDLATDAGPPFNAVSHIAPDVRQQARAIDDDLSRSGVTKALHGIPIWIKDNIDVEALPTTCGCAVFQDNIAKRDAILVGNLRSAGAVIMGKVGMTELGSGGGVPGLSAYSTMSGRIGNAFDPRNPPGGSSAGSAVAVSLNFGIAAVGVDDCASISEPAALNGCVGFRPTVGLVSRDGLFTYAESETSPGPIARTVRDAAALLDGLVGDTGGGTFREGLYRRSIAGARIGVLAAAGPLDMTVDVPRCVKEKFRERLAQLEDAGATIVENSRLEHFKVKRQAQLQYYNSHIASLRARATSPRTPRQLYSSDRLAPHTRRIGRHPVIRYGMPVPLPNVLAWSYRRVQTYNKAALSYMLQNAGCDCVIAITTPRVSVLATLAAAPHLTVPAGFVEADQEMTGRGFVEGTTVPWGISIVGETGSDRRVLAVGHAFERLFQARRSPAFPLREKNAPDACDIMQSNRLRAEIARRCRGKLELDSTGARYVHPTSDEFRWLVQCAVHELSD